MAAGLFGRIELEELRDTDVHHLAALFAGLEFPLLHGLQGRIFKFTVGRFDDLGLDHITLGADDELDDNRAVDAGAPHVIGISRFRLEAGFGPLSFTSPAPFADLDKARVWIEECLLARSGTGTVRPESD